MIKAIFKVLNFTNKVSLVQGNEYAIIGFEERGPNKLFYRVINESGEASLYPSDYFVEEVFSPPPDWVVSKFEDWIDIYSPELSDPWFFLIIYPKTNLNKLGYLTTFCTGTKFS